MCNILIQATFLRPHAHLLTHAITHLANNVVLVQIQVKTLNWNVCLLLLQIPFLGFSTHHGCNEWLFELP